MQSSSLLQDRRLSAAQPRPDRLPGRGAPEDVAQVQGAEGGRKVSEQQHLRRLQRRHQRVRRS